MSHSYSSDRAAIKRSKRYKSWSTPVHPHLLRCDKCNVIFNRIAMASDERIARHQLANDIARHEAEEHPDETCPPINTCWQASVPAARRAPKKPVREQEHAAAVMEKALVGAK